MPSPSVPLAKLGFLTIGSFGGDDPRAGHESTLEVIELGEHLGQQGQAHQAAGPGTGLWAAARARTDLLRPGTAVVNIDNGYGAGVFAARIARRSARAAGAA